MFEEIFSYPTALRRHREGPLSSERREYLQYLRERGAAAGTVVRQARYCLSIAQEIQPASRTLLQSCRARGHRLFLGSETSGCGTGRHSSLAQGELPFRCPQLFGTAWPSSTRSSSPTRPL